MDNTGITCENYEEKRRELIEANSNLVGLVLNEKERMLDEYLTAIKKEFRDGFSWDIPYSIPTLTDKRLTSSRLYRFCSLMPKGADLHVHDMALLPAAELIKLLLTRPEFCINADRKSFDLITVAPGDAVPDGYMRFSDAVNGGYYSSDELIYNWTVAGADSYGTSIWDYFEELFCRHGAMSDNPSFARAYYEYAFRYYCRANIQHVEIHEMLTESMDETTEYLTAMLEAYYAVKKEYPYFTVKLIGAGVKADGENIELTKKCFLNTAYAQETVKDESGDTVKDFVIGFDLVNEEDSSLPLHAFAPMLLKAKKQFPNMRFYIHGGESINAGNENLIDAYLLGASRVGHGLNLYRYPDLHSKYIESEICLEVCPISNISLGYTKDIRNHPATEYLRSGASISLCSDDPAYMENETLTDDFFAAAVGWDLGVADMKQLAVNSITYSGLSSSEKTVALREYRRMWNAFVDKTLERQTD